MNTSLLTKFAAAIAALLLLAGTATSAPINEVDEADQLTIQECYLGPNGWQCD